MLRWIRIRNVAVIDEIEVDFEPGLNLITGETGAGKSILIDALGLVLGSRATPELVREGADKAFVEAAFEPGSAPGTVSGILADAGIELDPDDDVVIRREVSAGGRGKIIVNGAAAPRAVLRELAPHLADIHGQGDHFALRRPGAALALLDRFDGNDPLRGTVGQAYREMRELDRRRKELERASDEREARRERLAFELAEIERVDPAPGEDVKLLEEHRRGAHAERLRSLSEEAYASLYEADESAVAQLGSVWKRLEELARIDGQWESTLEVRADVMGPLEDLALRLRDYAADIDLSPERAEELESRLAQVERLKKKHGGSLDRVLERREECEKELTELLTSRDALDRTVEAGSAARERYLAAARRLSAAREAAAKKLARLMANELPSLALEKARFEVALETESGTADAAHRESGIDAVSFLFSANPGEEPRPLERVASGGELSRFLLALESLSAKGEAPKTLVFDEVDAGIGGRVADAVGEKLRELSHTHQVICVTHLPQVASFAPAHYRIDKIVEKGRTGTRIARLDEEGRVDELARMLAGARVGESARRHARQLMMEKKEVVKLK